ALREGVVSAPRLAGDRRQGADRGRGRLHDDLFGRRLQRLPAAEILRDLNASRPPRPTGAGLPQNPNNEPGRPDRWSRREGCRSTLEREASAMIDIRQDRPGDVAAREALLDSCFGPGRFQKTCERLREGRLPAEGLSLVATRDGVLAGTVRLWHVRLGQGGEG